MPFRTVIAPHTSHAGASPINWALDWSSTEAVACAYASAASPSLIVADAAAPPKDSPVNRPSSATESRLDAPSVFAWPLNSKEPEMGSAEPIDPLPSPSTLEKRAAVGFAAAFGSSGACILPFAVGAIASAAGVKVLQPIILAAIVLCLVIWLLIPKLPKQRMVA